MTTEELNCSILNGIEDDTLGASKTLCESPRVVNSCQELLS